MPSKLTKRSRPKPELATSQPDTDIQQRLLRIRTDTRALTGLSQVEARAIYPQLEAARDLMSFILDRADGK
jgi:hypothetical protein